MTEQRICVMGLGYIGLPTASLLATKGFRVHGVDVNPRVVRTISEGRIHIVEPDLDVLVRAAVSSGNLTASTEPVEAEVFILAVPTPFGEGHAPDLRFVEASTQAIAPRVRAGDLVILESTSPVGTTERVAEILFGARPELRGEIAVAHCPERVLPGQILRELVDNDRVVGGIDARSTEQASTFYRRFVRGEVVCTSARTAELCKLVENSYRDVNIAFANELSLICDALGVPVWEVIELANRHPRVAMLRPGPGVGGHCLAVDPWFIIHSVPEHARLIRTARQVNDAKTDWVIERVLAQADRFRDPVVACLGLAYKPDVDDLRESPALRIYERLKEALGEHKVLAVEPNLPSSDARALVDLDHALERADVVVALVAHRPFRAVDPERLKAKVVIDTCGVFR
ncbi:MAG: UDP-N-acetyl-D-mannosamine dehydrogenase [Deltaproteobacteria bacterium]|nr:MAG: UDP-N-acetyl-D-mannosamine dehydrogenase [Deltaproteobacteria bacterium]